MHQLVNFDNIKMHGTNVKKKTTFYAFGMRFHRTAKFVLESAVGQAKAIPMKERNGKLPSFSTRAHLLCDRYSIHFTAPSQLLLRLATVSKQKEIKRVK